MFSSLRKHFISENIFLSKLSFSINISCCVCAILTNLPSRHESIIFSIAVLFTILSFNESKQKINQVIDDILNPSSKIEDNKYILEQSFQSPLKEAREHFEKEYLTTQLKKHHGNISKTADFIGMERSALHRKLKILGIKGIN